MKLERRRVGRTSLEVTALGLGGATLGGNRARVSEAEARMIVTDAIDSGIGYFDTAPFYGFGRSERVVGDMLREHDGWILSSKVGRLLRPRHAPPPPDGPWRAPLPFEGVFDYSYDGAMRSYEDSLQRLGLNRIDILYIHDVDTMTHGHEQQPAMHGRAMAGAYKALEELRRNGDIKAIGIGVNEAAADCGRARPRPVGLLPPRRTLYAPRAGQPDDTPSGGREARCLDRRRRAVQFRHPRRQGHVELRERSGSDPRARRGDQHASATRTAFRSPPRRCSFPSPIGSWRASSRDRARPPN